MIVKKKFNPLKIWSYIQLELSILFLYTFILWYLFYTFELKNIALPFLPVSIIASALAIFVAFRNNTAYNRWWEARNLWANILSSSRVLARLVITFTDSHSKQPNYNLEKSNLFKNEMIHLLIAWSKSLNFTLRNNQNYESLNLNLSEMESEKFLLSQNKTSFITLRMGEKIYQAMGEGVLGGFDSFQMEGQLFNLTNYQSNAEKIKDTPLLRQYDYFTKVFVIIFGLLLPHSLLSIFTYETRYMILPISFLILGIFIIMEKTGAVNEDPFENKITDVPLDFICNTIEIELLSMLGEKNLPEKTKVENGYLF